MVKVVQKCPLGVYIIQTPWTLSASHRYLLARIPDTYFIKVGKGWRREEGLYSDD